MGGVAHFLLVASSTVFLRYSLTPILASQTSAGLFVTICSWRCYERGEGMLRVKEDVACERRECA